MKLYDFASSLQALNQGQQTGDRVRKRMGLKDFAAAMESGDFEAASGQLAKMGDIDGAMKTRRIPVTDEADQLGNEYTRTRIDDVGIDNQRADRVFNANQAQRRYSNARAEAEARLKVAEGPSFGKSPVYGTDAEGNTILIQVADDGTAVRTPLPEGVNITPGIQKFDTGTEIVMVDSRSGNIISRTPKDVAGEAEQGVLGKIRGERSVSAPKEAAQLQNMLGTIEDLQNDPNRERGTGKSSMFNSIPGTPGFDYQQKVNQLQGQTFLQARDLLKGAGALSDAESLKGEQAMARLSTAQSEEAYNAALQDLQEATQLLYDRINSLQGGQQAAPQPPGQTSSGVKWSIE